MSKENKLKVTLVRSTAKKLACHKATVESLGLRRLHHAVVVNDNPATRGMINKIGYLLKIEEVK